MRAYGILRLLTHRVIAHEPGRVDHSDCAWPVCWRVIAAVDAVVAAGLSGEHVRHPALILLSGERTEKYFCDVFVFVFRNWPGGQGGLGGCRQSRLSLAHRIAGSARVTTPCHRRVTCLEQNIVEGVN